MVSILPCWGVMNIVPLGCVGLLWSISAMQLLPNNLCNRGFSCRWRKCLLACPLFRSAPQSGHFVRHLNCFLNRMQSFTQMSYETGVTICGSITCRAVSYEPGRLCGAGRRDFCIANTEERASLLIPGCSQNNWKQFTRICNTECGDPSKSGASLSLCIARHSCNRILYSIDVSPSTAYTSSTSCIDAFSIAGHSDEDSGACN